MELEFTVTITVGYHRSGDVNVEIEVTDEEYEVLRQCYEDDMDICDCPELEDLQERIIDEAKEDSEIWESEDDDGYIDLDDAEFFIQIPEDLEE